MIEYRWLSRDNAWLPRTGICMCAIQRIQGLECVLGPCACVFRGSKDLCEYGGLARAIRGSEVSSSRGALQHDAADGGAGHCGELDMKVLKPLGKRNSAGAKRRTRLERKKCKEI
jgi:hypothetical protein